MKIILKTILDDNDGYEPSNEHVLIVNDIERHAIREKLEPEDCYFFRRLPSPFDFIDIIKEAYEAGKAGEELIIESIETHE
jgi:hypothetical protein